MACDSVDCTTRRQLALRRPCPSLCASFSSNRSKTVFSATRPPRTPSVRCSHPNPAHPSLPVVNCFRTQQAKAAVDAARSQVADFLGCSPDEIIFTSGGSESANYALRGVCALCVPPRCTCAAPHPHSHPVPLPLTLTLTLCRSYPKCHIVTTAFEHYVVPKNIERFLEPAGHSATVVAVLPNGLVDLDAFAAALTPETRMVSVMLVQNETGIVQPIREICDAAHQVGALVHVDACQAAGKIPINVAELGCDLLSIAGHKFSGPPGTGALFVRRGVDIPPLIVGAAQQGGRRAGTEAVMNCAAMGVACCEAQKWLSGNGPFFQTGIRGRVVQFIKKWCRDNDVAVVFHGEGSPVVPTVSPRPPLLKPQYVALRHIFALLF